MQEKAHRKVHKQCMRFVSCPFLPPIRSLSQFLARSTGTLRGRVPWTDIQRARDEYIKPEYLPKNVILKQFHHLRQKDVDAILTHWIGRQASGRVPLRFKKVDKATRKDHHVPEGGDADADMGPGDEADGDRQCDDSSQPLGGGLLQVGTGSNSSTEQAPLGRNLGNAAENPNRVS